MNAILRRERITSLRNSRHARPARSEGRGLGLSLPGCPGATRAFPTRRSSDLIPDVVVPSRQQRPNALADKPPVAPFRPGPLVWVPATPFTSFRAYHPTTAEALP